MKEENKEIKLKNSINTTSAIMPNGWYYTEPVFNYETYSSLCRSGQWEGGLVLDWSGMQIGDYEWNSLIQHSAFPSSYWAGRLQDMMRFAGGRMQLTQYSSCTNSYEEQPQNEISSRWRIERELANEGGDSYDEYFHYKRVYMIGLASDHFDVTAEMAADMLKGINVISKAPALAQGITQTFHREAGEFINNGKEVYLSMGENKNTFYLYHLRPLPEYSLIVKLGRIEVS